MENVETGKRRHRLRRRGLLMAGAGVVLAVVLLVRMVLPVLVERGIAHGSRAFAGLPARVGNADLSLLGGRVVLEDVSVGAAPDGVGPWEAAWNPPQVDAPLLHVDALVVQWSWPALLRGNLRLEELAMESPSARIIREKDGSIAPLGKTRAVAQGPPAPAPAAEAAGDGPHARPVVIRSLVLRSPALILIDGASRASLVEFSLESFELEDVLLQEGDLGFGAVRVQGPELRVWRDFVAGASGGAIPAGGQPAPAAAPPPDLRINKIEVERARFTWMSAEGPLDVRMTLRASNVTAREGRRFPVSADAEIGQGRVGIDGEAGLAPPYFRGSVKWNDLAFPPLVLAAFPELAGWIRSADASGDLRVEAALAGIEGAPCIRLSGKAGVAGFSAAEPDGGRLSVAWDSLDVSLENLVVPLPEEGKPARPIVAGIESLRLAGPRIAYTRPWAPLEDLIVGSAGSPATESSSADWLRLEIGGAEVAGGVIDFVDTILGADVRVRDVSAWMRDFVFPDNTFGSLYVGAFLPEESRLSLWGNLGGGFLGEFQLNMRDLDLPSVSAFAKPAGIGLHAGRLSLESRMVLGAEGIRAENEIVLNKPGVSMGDPDSFAKEFGLPINLALVLLRDAAGDIRLTVPFRMDEKGAAVSFGSVVGSAMRAALTGALTSPLKMAGLGAANPKSGSARNSPPTAGLEPVGFPPGLAEPGPEAAGRAAGLVKLLARRPDLALVLRGSGGPEDRPQLARQILIERVMAGKGLPELHDAGFLARRRIAGYFSRIGRGESATLDAKDEALVGRFVEATEVTGDRVAALAERRAEKLRDLLVARGLPTARILMEKPVTTGKPAVALDLRDLLNKGTESAEPTPTAR